MTDARRGRVVDDVRYRVRGHHDEGQVHGLGQVPEAAHGRTAEHGLVPGVHRDQRAGEADRGAAGQDELRPARGVRRAHDGEAARCEELPQALRGDAHVPAFALPSVLAFGSSGLGSSGRRLLGQAEGPLADDGALDLAGAGVDGARAAAQEDVLPLAGRVAVAFGPEQAVGADDAHRDLAEPLVVFAPEQLVDRGLGAGRLPGGDLGQRAQPAEAHQLDAGVGLGQLLAHQRIGGPAVLAGRLDQVPELPLVPQMLHGRGAAALVAERGHGDPPAVVQAADHVEQRDADAVQEVLVELRRSGQLPDRPVPDLRHGERDQHVGQALVFLGDRVGPAQEEHHRRPARTRGPQLLPGDDDLVAVDLAAGLHPSQVGSVVGLGEALAVDVLAADDAGQEVLALFVGAVHDHRRADQGLAHAADHPRYPGPVELLVQHRDPHRVQALAAELGRPVRADEPGVGQRVLPLRVGGMPQRFGQPRLPVTATDRGHRASR